MAAQESAPRTSAPIGGLGVDREGQTTATGNDARTTALEVEALIEEAHREHAPIRSIVTQRDYCTTCEHTQYPCLAVRLVAALEAPVVGESQELPVLRDSAAELREATRNLPARIVERIEVSPTGCWEWTGPTNGDGYAQYKLAYVHRTVYELLVGPIAAGLEIDHLCHVRRCCNPSHLEAVTHAENVARSDVGAPNARKTHCPKGHAYDEANTYVSSAGSRRCRTCDRLNADSRRKAAEFESVRSSLEQESANEHEAAESAVLLRAAAEFEYHAGNRAPHLSNEENRALSDANIRAAVHLRHLARYGFNPVATRERQSGDFSALLETPTYELLEKSPEQHSAGEASA